MGEGLGAICPGRAGKLPIGSQTHLRPSHALVCAADTAFPRPSCPLAAGQCPARIPALALCPSLHQPDCFRTKSWGHLKEGSISSCS